MSAYRSSVAFVNSISTGPAAISARKPWLCVPVYSNANERHSLVRVVADDQRRAVGEPQVAAALPSP